MPGSSISTNTGGMTGHPMMMSPARSRKDDLGGSTAKGQKLASAKPPTLGIHVSGPRTKATAVSVNLKYGFHFSRGVARQQTADGHAGMAPFVAESEDKKVGRAVHNQGHRRER